MTNIRELLTVLAAKEEELRGLRFLAPCVRGGVVRLRVDGLVYSFMPVPTEFEGWGIFEPVDEETAQLVEEASPRLVGEYLSLFKRIRLRLASRVHGQTWLAYPANEADAQQRLGTRGPQQVYLVSEGMQFEQVVARWDGAVCWFEEIDRRADPTDAERLRKALNDDTLPAHLGWKNCTPEMRGCYVQVRQRQKRGHHSKRRRSDEERLREALAFDGGELRAVHDRGNYWQIEWATRADGDTHTSAIEKRDFTVMSAGICLSGLDSDFDLQSLVRVVEVGDEYWQR
ncbi:MAG TPA: hypothetical protein VGO69_09555 [Pyrinomonadaceae bacterium]|nr:hypothetical protein [Pyrinomonadaceae bacterium]